MEVEVIMVVAPEAKVMVSVLFSDVVGFTALSAALRPDQVPQTPPRAHCAAQRPPVGGEGGGVLGRSRERR